MKFIKLNQSRIKLANMILEDNKTPHLVFQLKDLNRNITKLHITPSKVWMTGPSGMGHGLANIFISTQAVRRLNMNYMELQNFLKRKILALAKSYNYDAAKIAKALGNGSNSHPWLLLAGTVVKYQEMN